ncbi:MAG TPA: terminase small subunit [Steroidobacteraceae bacterium]|nr:terminase small subunit [Steroidobacteraceae bacterium]
MARVSRSQCVQIAYAPNSERDRKFCQRWLVHFDHVRAYQEAGFKGKAHFIATRAKQKLERFAAYLQPLQEAKARKVGEQLAIGEEDVLRGMAAVAFLDPGDFVEQSSDPLTDDKGNVVQFNGQPVYPLRLKPLNKLTREQRAAVDVVTSKRGHVSYRLPDSSIRHRYQDSIGRQLGMFAEKLILERHSLKRTHVKLDLTGVPTSQLEQMTRMLLPLLGEDFARELGVEDLLAASKDGHA